MSGRVLVATTDRKTAELAKLHLEKAGYHVATACDGRTALEMVRAQHPNLVVLDLVMPELDGADVCRLLRSESEVPIVMLTGGTTEDNRITGLDPGANGYVTKPFSPRELVDRVETVLGMVAEQEAERGPQQLQLGHVLVDFRRNEVRSDEGPVPLTPTEFKLLKLLATELGRAFSRAQLVDLLLGRGYEGFERTIDLHILNLRKKIEPDPSNPRYLLSVSDVGYKLRRNGDDS